VGDPDPGVQYGPQFLRRLPDQRPAGQLAPGTTGLLRCSYFPHQAGVRECKLPGGQRHTRQLDRPWGQRIRLDLYRLVNHPMPLGGCSSPETRRVEVGRKRRDEPMHQLVEVDFYPFIEAKSTD